LSTTVTLAAAAALRLSLAHVSWLASYELDNRALFFDGVLGDFTVRKPTRFGLVNLQVALYPLVRSREITNLMVLILVAVLVAIAIMAMLKSRLSDDLLCLSTICVVSLLPIYHRFYDAALLIIPLSWLVSRAGRHLESSLFAGFIFVSAFLLPGGSLLETLCNRGAFSEALMGNRWWNGLVMAHEPWLILMFSVILISRIARCADSSLYREWRVKPCSAA